MKRPVRLSRFLFFLGLVVFFFSTAFPAHADTVFSEDFESGGSGWTIDNGVWEVGVPTSGPVGCQEGIQCAATVLAGNYPASTDSRLISPAIQLPEVSGSDEIELRFWHWFSFGAWDGGRVKISEETAPGQWSDLTELTYYEGNSSGIWSRPRIDLSGYAGKKIRIAFVLDNSSCCGDSSGWYIDEVSIEVKVNATKPVPFVEHFDTGLGDWAVENGTWEVGAPASGPDGAYSGEGVAATVLGGNYWNYDDRFKDRYLISPVIQLPEVSGSDEIELRFWHWFSFGAWDGGRVKISEETAPGQWSDLTELTYYEGNSSGIWSRPRIDLSGYAGKKIRIAFVLDNSSCCGDSSGWYIDEVTIDTTTATNHPPELSPLSDVAVNENDTLTIPLAATDPNPADTLTLEIVTGPSFVSFSDKGDGTGELVAAPGFDDGGSDPYPITVKVTDLGLLSHSLSFDLTVND